MPSDRWVLVLTLVLIPPVAASDLRGVSAPSAPGVAVRASGEWATGGAGAGGGGKRWSVAAMRMSDDEIRGRVTFEGMSAGDDVGEGGANVEARLSGRGVVGKLLDDDGRTLAVFEGAMSARGGSGTFRHVGGASGTWTWDGSSRADGSKDAE